MTTHRALALTTTTCAAPDEPWHDFDHVMSCDAATAADPARFPECVR